MRVVGTVKVGLDLCSITNTFDLYVHFIFVNNVLSTHGYTYHVIS